MLLLVLTAILIFFALRAVALVFLIFTRRAPDRQADSQVTLRKRTSRGGHVDDASATPASPASTAADAASIRPVRTLIVLGSGGHTAEMLSVLDAVPRAHFAPLLFVSAATDVSSESRALRREQERGNQHQVGQSYLTSVLSTLVALMHSARVVYDFKPELSLSLSGLILYPLVDEFVVQWPQLARKDKEGETTEEKVKATATQTAVSTTLAAPPAPHGWRWAKYIGRLC